MCLIDKETNVFFHSKSWILPSIFRLTNPAGKIHTALPVEKISSIFNRLELEENIFELYPTGALIVRDLKDIVSFIANNKIVSIKLQFDDKTFISLSITSTTYVNNAASNTEENFVSINVSNSF